MIELFAKAGKQDLPLSKQRDNILINSFNHNTQPGDHPMAWTHDMLSSPWLSRGGGVCSLTQPTL